MQLLLIIPDTAVRHSLRDRLRHVPMQRSDHYGFGLVLAEQSRPSEIVVWSRKGADSEVIDVVQRLKRMHRDARIFVITPEITKAGVAAMIDHLEVDAYLPDSEFDVIVETILGVPSIVENSERKTIVSARPGSSVARN